MTDRVRKRESGLQILRQIRHKLDSREFCGQQVHAHILIAKDRQNSFFQLRRVRVLRFAGLRLLRVYC